jgi:hypothetical protein
MKVKNSTRTDFINLYHESFLLCTQGYDTHEAGFFQVFGTGL